MKAEVPVIITTTTTTAAAATTHDDNSHGSKAFSGVCDSVCLSVCLSTTKQELSYRKQIARQLHKH